MHMTISNIRKTIISPVAKFTGNEAVTLGSRFLFLSLDEITSQAFLGLFFSFPLTVLKFMRKTQLIKERCSLSPRCKMALIMFCHTPRM